MNRESRFTIGLAGQENFYRMLDYKRRLKHMSFRDIERQTGVASSTISRLAHGKAISSLDIFVLFDWLKKK